MINPSAGRRMAGDYEKAIADRLSSAGHEFLIEHTSRVGEATSRANAAVENGADIVVAVGGDGTVCEVINGIAESRVRLGIIPLGTVNVFCREIGIPLDPLKATDVIASGIDREVDLGRAGDHYFLVMAGIGFDAQVVAEVDPHVKKIFHEAAYSLAGLKAFYNYQPVKMYITADEQRLMRNGYAVIIGNARGYAGLVEITPHAKIDDGVFDVCIFKKRKPFHVLRYIAGVVLKRHTGFSDVEYIKASRLKIESQRPVLVHVDGDIIGHTPMDFECLHKAIRIRVPAETPE
jgi:YegS/Rv2252/BmrU family lipid kinase